MQVFVTAEVAPALAQLAVTLGLGLLFLHLYRRYRKAHFLWWAAAWGLYAFRLLAIVGFLATSFWPLLYWHQVVTGWTALAFLWAALVFSRRQPWRPAFAWLLLVPVAWSWVAIFVLDHFALAAGVTVVLLSGATAWTGVVFLRHRRITGSAAAGALTVTLLLWSLHHLDYPLLRARGAWNPWGYYLDLLFVLAVGTGLLLLVIEEQRQGLITLSTLSGELRGAGADRDALLDELLRRPLALQGMQGAALVALPGGDGPTALRGVGSAQRWAQEGVPPQVVPMLHSALTAGQPVLSGVPGPSPGAPPFVGVLPLGRGPRASGGLALVAVGDMAAPFAALDDSILVAIGEQIGAALENAELHTALARRTEDLERLSVRMIQQHEEQRQRLHRELHDETAQVFAGLRLQLGSLRETVEGEQLQRIDRILALVGAGSRSIRSVTEDLRPALLDDLGLLPALRGLVRDFEEWSGIRANLEAPEALGRLGDPAELALFRAAQEALVNVARHAQAREVALHLKATPDGVELLVDDDGTGLSPGERERVLSGPGRSGLFGMRERLANVRGRLGLEEAPAGGLRLRITVPRPGDHDR